jgi:hypothetical protein
VCVLGQWNALPAGIPEPDVVFHGTITLAGRQVLRSDNPDVTLLARVNGVPDPVGSYHFGDIQAYGDEYVLRIRLESLADGAPQSRNAAVIGQSVRVFLKQGTAPETEATSFVVTDRGLIRRLNLSDVRIPDLDGDGDSDLADYAVFQRCFTGTDAGPLSSSCQAADLNGDGKVNLTDYDRFADRVKGPS